MGMDFFGTKSHRQDETMGGCRKEGSDFWFLPSLVTYNLHEAINFGHLSQLVVIRHRVRRPRIYFGKIEKWGEIYFDAVVILIPIIKNQRNQVEPLDMPCTQPAAIAIKKPTIYNSRELPIRRENATAVQSYDHVLCGPVPFQFL